MKKALSGQDAVIWCVRIPMSRSYEKMESLEGHKVLIEAMKFNKVKRLVDWATPSVKSSEDKNSFITIFPGIAAGIMFNQAKKEIIAIGELIQNSDLDWTIVRFLGPTDSPYTGKVTITFGGLSIGIYISREDIGAFMVEQVEDTNYIKSMPIIGS